MNRYLHYFSIHISKTLVIPYLCLNYKLYGLQGVSTLSMHLRDRGTYNIA